MGYRCNHLPCKGHYNFIPTDQLSSLERGAVLLEKARRWIVHCFESQAWVTVGDQQSAPTRRWETSRMAWSWSQVPGWIINSGLKCHILCFNSRRSQKITTLFLRCVIPTLAHSLCTEVCDDCANYRGGVFMINAMMTMRCFFPSSSSLRLLHMYSPIRCSELIP